MPIVVTVAGLFLVQRVVPSALRQEHNDVAGFIYAVVGVTYAVLPAFVVIVVGEDYETARGALESEANELAGVYYLADQFPAGAHVQELARSYARAVVEEEWSLMEQGETSERAGALLRELRFSLRNVDASTGAGQVFYGTPEGSGCWRPGRGCPVSSGSFSWEAGWSRWASPTSSDSRTTARTRSWSPL